MQQNWRRTVAATLLSPQCACAKGRARSHGAPPHAPDGIKPCICTRPGRRHSASLCQNLAQPIPARARPRYGHRPSLHTAGLSTPPPDCGLLSCAAATSAARAVSRYSTALVRSELRMKVAPGGGVRAPKCVGRARPSVQDAQRLLTAHSCGSGLTVRGRRARREGCAAATHIRCAACAAPGPSRSAAGRPQGRWSRRWS
jgi:hypothetical protein